MGWDGHAIWPNSPLGTCATNEIAIWPLSRDHHILERLHGRPDAVGQTRPSFTIRDATLSIVRTEQARTLQDSVMLVFAAALLLGVLTPLAVVGQQHQSD